VAAAVFAGEGVLRCALQCVVAVFVAVHSMKDHSHRGSCGVRAEECVVVCVAVWRCSVCCSVCCSVLQCVLQCVL